jgi:hypothetical protein
MQTSPSPNIQLFVKVRVVNFLSKHRATGFLDFAHRLVFQTKYMEYNVAETGHFSKFLRGGEDTYTVGFLRKS